MRSIIIAMITLACIVPAHADEIVTDEVRRCANLRVFAGLAMLRHQDGKASRGKADSPVKKMILELALATPRETDPIRKDIVIERFHSDIAQACRDGKI